jgi:flagellar biosynthesis protein FlhA
VLPARLEELITKSLKASRESGLGAEIEAETAGHLRQAAQTAARAMRSRGQKPVLVVPGAIRRAVARTIGALIPVLALEEIPDTMALQVVQTAEPAVTHA